MKPCPLCGHPAPYPVTYEDLRQAMDVNGESYHLSCVAGEFARLQNRYKSLIDRAYVAGTYGPWSDDWDWKDNRYLGENSFAEWRDNS